MCEQVGFVCDSPHELFSSRAESSFEFSSMDSHVCASQLVSLVALPRNERGELAFPQLVAWQGKASWRVQLIEASQ
jgi:hypothetical protein